jgi:hypothetical protein
MTTLRDRMHETVDSTHTDLATLVERSRRQGTTLRRRRRLAAAGSAVAVLAVVGAGAVAAGGLLPGGDATPVAGDGGHHAKAIDKPAHKAHPTPKARFGTETRPADGRLTAAALYTAVTDLAPGTGSDFAGQSPAGGSPDTYAEFAFTPADGSGAGLVGVNVQDASILADGDVGPREGFRCLDWMRECQVVDQPDGSLLRTYAERSEAAGGGIGVRLVAERLTPGGVRVVASAQNGFEGPSNQWDIRRPDAVLSTAQLAEVVSQAWWGFELPAGVPDVPAYREIPSS